MRGTGYPSDEQRGMWQASSVRGHRESGRRWAGQGSRGYRSKGSIQLWYWCYATVLGALSLLPMMSGGGLLRYVGRHSLRPGDGAESPRQGQALHDLVRDQRLLAASSEAHCPVSGQNWGTHQSELDAERESLRHHHGGIVRATIHESQAS